MGWPLLLVLAGAVLWLVTVIWVIRDRRASRWNRLVVGLLLVALPPVATVYWLQH